MDVWLIEDGERRGPFPQFEIERRILDGDLEPDCPAWVEGQGSWQEISRSPQFAAVFERARDALQGGPEPDPAAGQAEPEPEPVAAQPPELPAQAVTTAQLLRRFWARWFDLHLFGVIWWSGMRLAGHDLAALMTDMWMLVWQMLPWFAIEALMIHLWGTTPGKALLGIRVRQADGSPPSIGASVWRSLRVWTLGLGLGMPLLVILCQGLSLWTSRRLGRPLWDVAGDHRVAVGPLRPARLSLFVGLFVVLIGLRGWVLMPAVEELYGDKLELLRQPARSSS
jgi:uncharacterized RDD family membrane protein YckC